MSDGQGIPIAVALSGANQHDVTMLADLLDAQMIEKRPLKNYKMIDQDCERHFNFLILYIINRHIKYQ
jgi:hypothetical protein